MQQARTWVHPPPYVAPAAVPVAAAGAADGDDLPTDQMATLLRSFCQARVGGATPPSCPQPALVSRMLLEAAGKYPAAKRGFYIITNAWLRSLCAHLSPPDDVKAKVLGLSRSLMPEDGPLRMCLTGQVVLARAHSPSLTLRVLQAGAGKSWLIKAVRKFVALWGLPDTLYIAGSTGLAGCLLDGPTGTSVLVA